MITVNYEYSHLRNGVMNTRIPVKTTSTGIDIAVSLSYSRNSDFYSIGTKEDPQGAILLCGLGLEDLYTLPQEEGVRTVTNVKDCNTDEDVQNLIELANGINPTHCICIWDTPGPEPKRWWPRFLIEEGTLDADEKLAYTFQVYAKPHFKEKRFVLTSDIKGIANGTFFASLPAPQL